MNTKFAMEQSTYAHVFIINVVKVKSFSHKADIFVSVKEEPISWLNKFPREIEQIVVTSYDTHTLISLSNNFEYTGTCC